MKQFTARQVYADGIVHDERIVSRLCSAIFSQTRITVLYIKLIVFIETYALCYIHL